MNEGDVYVFKSIDTNPDNGPLFVGYFVLNNEFVGIRFEGKTEDEVREKAIKLFRETKQKREETRARIAEGRRKSALTKAKRD